MLRRAGDNHGQHGLESLRAKLREYLNIVRPPWIPQALPKEGEPHWTGVAWEWGLHAVEHFSQLLFDLLRRTQRLAYRADADSLDLLARSWRQAYDTLERVKRLRTGEAEFWRRAAKNHADRCVGDKAGDAAQLQEWFFGALAEWGGQRVTISSDSHAGGANAEVPRQEACWILAHKIAEVLRATLGGAEQLATEASNSPNAFERAEADQLRAHLQFFSDAGDVAPTDEIVRRMLVLEVIQTVLAGQGRDVEQVIDLIQVSGNERNAFDGRRTADEKLAGAQLGHFGAFYKHSWRASDWMFGRLDMVPRLVRVLLNPDRLREVYGAGCFRPAMIDGSRSERVADLVQDLAVNSAADEETRDLLAEKFDRSKVCAELAFLDDATAEVPEFLPDCVQAITRRLQLDIVCEEILPVARAVEEDLVRGSDPSGPGASFLRAVRDRPGNERLTAKEAVELFCVCRIGSERIAEEIGTDLFATTASHAAAVTATLGTGKRSGLGVFRHLMRVISAPAIMLYLLVRNATRGSRVGPVINAFALGIGLTIVVLDLFSEGVGFPRAVTGMAIALVVAGVAFLCLRSRVLVPICLLLAAAAAILFGTGVFGSSWDRTIARAVPGFLRSASLAFGVTLSLMVVWRAIEPRLKKYRSHSVSVSGRRAEKTDRPTPDGSSSEEPEA